MAVSTAYVPLTYTGDGSTTNFPVTWPFFTGSLVVTEIVIATGVETVKSITTHYTVTGGTAADGTPSFGTVVAVAAPASTVQWRITRATAQTQALTLSNNDAFPAKSIEAAFDKGLLIAQEGVAAAVDEITGDFMQLNSAGATNYWDGESHILRNLADAVGATDAVTLTQLQAAAVTPLAGIPLLISNGGTGQTIATAAFDALAPTTTRGDIIARGAASNGRLAVGASGYHLQSDGTDPAWAGFLQTGTGAVTRSWQGKAAEIKSVLDYIPVAEHAAIIAYTSTTDLSTYLQAAIDAAEAGGFRLHALAGRYRFGTGLTIQANNVVIIGDGDGTSGGTQFEYTSTTGDIFTINNSAQLAGIENCRISCTGRPTAGYAIKVSGSAYIARIRRVRIDYCYNGILIDGASETRIEGVQVRYLLGQRGIQFGGSASQNFRAIVSDFVANNPYPQAYGTVKTWAISTGFSLNDIIFNNGRIYQCSTAGTSAGVGTGPSGLPSGSDPASAFSNTIADGTAAWKFVCNDLAWICQDSNAYSLVIEKAALLNGVQGFEMADTLATGSSYPIWAFVYDLECDHNFSTNALLDRGEGFYATVSWFGSCLNGNGILVNTNFRGEVEFSASRIVGCRQNGVLIQSGPVDVAFTGCVIGDNSQAGSGTFHGVVVGSNATRFKIVGCRIGDTIGTAGNNQGFGVLVSGGTSDNYIISGNQLSGNVSGAISDGGTGLNKTVSPDSGVGYIAGAGGTVTQATSKATGVTLNKWAGQITMNAANLAADTTVSFTLTNSVIGANDVLILNHAATGAFGSYLLNARCAAGSAVIDVRNITVGALAEAIQIRFVVIKGATA